MDERRGANSSQLHLYALPAMASFLPQPSTMFFCKGGASGKVEARAAGLGLGQGQWAQQPSRPSSQQLRGQLPRKRMI